MVRNWVISHGTFTLLQGPFLSHVDKIYSCPSEDFVLQLKASKWDPRKPLRLQTLTGNVTFSESSKGIDDTMWVREVAVTCQRLLS